MMSDLYYVDAKIIAVKYDGASLGSNSRTTLTAGGSSSIDFDASGNGWFGVLGYEYIRGAVRSDQDGDLYVQYSSDGATLDDVAIPTYQTVFQMNSATDATDGETTFYTCGFESKIIGQYARLVYVNGASGASNFNIVAFLAVEEGV